MSEGEPQPQPEPERDEQGDNTGDITGNEETVLLSKGTEVQGTTSSAFDQLTFGQRAKIADAAAAENSTAANKVVGVAPMVAIGRTPVGELGTKEPPEGFQPNRPSSDVYIDPKAQVDRSGEVATGRAVVPDLVPPGPGVVPPARDAIGEQNTIELDRP
jgi:hypothetical protein